jgi:hypothetical protein
VCPTPVPHQHACVHARVGVLMGCVGRWDGRCWTNWARAMLLARAVRLSVISSLGRGSLNRSTGETLMNSVSSRSHAIFSVGVKCTGSKNTVSKLHFVDLAGSERYVDLGQCDACSRSQFTAGC